MDERPGERSGSAGFFRAAPHSHAVIIRSTAAFRRDPRYDLVWIHDVAGLAMNAVGEVDMQLFAFRSIHHFVHRRRAEMLARIAKFLHATVVTNIHIAD